MSCFWDALIRELRPDEAQRAGLGGLNDARAFATGLKEAGGRAFVLTRWQGEELTESQRRENAAAVAAYDVDGVNAGYDCGSCDPFLLLLCHVAGVNIRHRSPSATISYTSVLPQARWLELRSDGGHMH